MMYLCLERHTSDGTRELVIAGRTTNALGLYVCSRAYRHDLVRMCNLWYARSFRTKLRRLRSRLD
jgi:hypothetical protein